MMVCAPTDFFMAFPPSEESVTIIADRAAAGQFRPLNPNPRKTLARVPDALPGAARPMNPEGPLTIPPVRGVVSCEGYTGEGKQRRTGPSFEVPDLPVEWDRPHV